MTILNLKTTKEVMYKLSLISFFLFLYLKGYSQVSNNDSKAGAINIALPKTPESQAFEKYGNIAVNEVTGNPNISVPIYILKSRFLQVPITLNYNASGIKVSQEASWVGLGFDLIAGGRITVETKGCIDNDGMSQSLYSTSNLKYGMDKFFNRLGNPNSASILTFASTCHGCDTAVTQNIPDDAQAFEAMAQYGAGEPDIFRASFLGNSLSFYFDKLTDELKFIGERSLFNISATIDGFQRITDWIVADNSGNKYYFNQKETTTLTMPPLGPLQNNTSTTAWLLTKIVHPTGDSVIFSYTNFGNSYPANSWSASISYMTEDDTYTLSNDQDQNTVIQQPAYLTKIER